MSPKSQTWTRLKLIALVALCAIPSCAEGYAVLWGERHGQTGKALRDGLDFWAGGFLALHGHLAMLYDHLAYQDFLTGQYGALPYHLWSYPPNYLLLASGFGWLSPWHAVLAFDACSLVLLVCLLRWSGQSGWLIAAVVASPASLESLLEHQNAALLTALIGGGLLLLPRRRLGAGVLIGLATIKPQLGLVLPLYLLRRAPSAFVAAALAAGLLAGASYLAFGPAAWLGFIHYTGPVMRNVLLTGQPPDFSGGLINVFALARPLGVQDALLAQAALTLACIAAGLWVESPAALLILSALACPYLHDYDLVGVALAVALLVRNRLVTGFAPGEPILFFLAWFGPGLLPWDPQFAHAAPVLLLALLASAARRGGFGRCDSLQVPPALPVSSAGRSPIPDPPSSMAPG